MEITSTIQKFYEVAQSRDFSRDCLFRILSINTGDGITTTFDEDDLIYAKGAKIPGRQIVNQVVNFMGLAFNLNGTTKYPGSEAYELKFLADEKSILRDKLENWSREEFDDETSTGNYFSAKADATIDLVQLDKDMNIIKHYKLIGVSLKNISDIAYIYEGDGKIVEITSTISYHYYKIVK